MTAEPLQLFDAPATRKLTEHQTVALDAITAAGYDGLHTDEIGAAVHAHDDRHGLDERCEYCGTRGQQLGKRLRTLGYVKQRRRKAPGGDKVSVWTVAGKLTPPVGDPRYDDIPY